MWVWNLRLQLTKLYKEETHTKNDMSLQKAYKIKCLTRFYYIITIFFTILTLMKYTNKTRSLIHILLQFFYVVQIRQIHSFISLNKIYQC